VNNGDTIYYINTGKAKSHADVKKVKHYVTISDGEKMDLTKEVEKQYRAWKKETGSKISIDEFVKKNKPYVSIEDEVVLNCMLVPRDIIDKEEDTYCSDVSEDIEYNVDKYVDMFNNRIKPLLVCFSKDIRSDILISNPKDKPYFTEEQCELVSGEPNRPGDQDTYEQLMTMEDKEFKFWTTYNLVPPFFEECGMGKWEDAVKDYQDRMRQEEEDGIAEEKRRYQDILDSLTEIEKTKFIDDGELPSALLSIVDLDPNSSNLISKMHEGAVIGNIDDIIATIYSDDEE
jgi:hypothetical protein